MARQPSLDCTTVSTPATISSSSSVSPRSSASDWEVSGSQPGSHICSCTSPASPLDLNTGLFDIDDEYPIIPGISDNFDFNFKSWPWSEPLISDEMLHPSLDSFEPSLETYTSPTCHLHSSFPSWGGPHATSNSMLPPHNLIEDEMMNAPLVLEDQGTSPRTISSVSSNQSHIVLGKRNSSSDADFEPSNESTAQPSIWAKKKHGKMSRATAHNLVEKKYRSNLNDKMLALRDSIPSLKTAAESAFCEGGRQEPSRKLNKAYILTEAKDYIVYLKKRNESLSRREKDLEARVKAFQMLSRSKYGKTWAV